MSQPARFELKEHIPTDVFRNIFEIIELDDPVYFCTVVDNDGAAKIYFEPAMDGLESLLECQMRVFLSKEDLSYYAKFLADNERTNITMWELKASELVKNLKKISIAYQDAGKKGIRAVICAIPEDQMIEVDTLWTDTDQFMV